LEIYWHNTILKTYEKNIDLYISPSEFAKDILVKRGINKNKIIALPHFANISGNKNAPESQHTEAKEKYALYSGRISREKGTENLIDIFKNTKNLKLYLAGDIEDDINIKNEKNIKHLGFLNENKLKKYIENSQFVISGSRLPETFGLIALEANAQGKAFLGFRSGAYSEIIIDGSNGYLAENEEKLTEMIKKIANNEVTFNEKEIMRNAEERFSQDEYWKNFSGILDKTGKNAKLTSQF